MTYRTRDNESRALLNPGCMSSPEPSRVEPIALLGEHASGGGLRNFKSQDVQGRVWIVLEAPSTGWSFFELWDEANADLSTHTSFQVSLLRSPCCQPSGEAYMAGPTEFHWCLPRLPGTTFTRVSQSGRNLAMTDTPALGQPHTKVESLITAPEMLLGWRLAITTGVYSSPKL